MKGKAQKYWQWKTQSKRRVKKGTYLFLFTFFFLVQLPILPAVLDVSMNKTEELVYVYVFLTVLPEEQVSGIQVECIYDNNNWEVMSVYPNESLSASEKELQFANTYSNLRIIAVGFNNYPILSGRLFTIQFRPITTETNVLDFKIVQVKLSSPQALSVSGTINDNNETETTSPEDTTADSNYADTTTNTATTDTIDSTDSSSTTLSDTNEVDTENNSASDVYSSQSIVSENKGSSQYSASPTTTADSKPQVSSATKYYPAFPSEYMPEVEMNPVSQNNQKTKTKLETTSNPNYNSKIVIPTKTSQEQIISNRDMYPNQSNPYVSPQLKSSGKHTQDMQNPLNKSLEETAFVISQDIPSKSDGNTHFRYSTNSTTLKNQSYNNTTIALNISNIPQTRGRSKECLNTEIYNKDYNIPENEMPLMFFITLITVSIIFLFLTTVLVERKVMPIERKSKEDL